VAGTFATLWTWPRHLAELLAGHDDGIVLVHSSWRTACGARDPRAAGACGSLVRRHHHAWPRAPGSILRVQRDAGIDDLLELDDDPRPFPRGWPPLLLRDPDLGVSDASVQWKVRAWLEATKPPVGA